MDLIQPGDIIHVYVKDTIPPKDKFVVILGVSEKKVEVLTVYINSKINTNIYRTKFQQDLCYPIKCADYRFLNYDSFIDLNEPREKSKTNIEWLLNNRPNAKKDTLKEEHLNDCQQLIHENRVIKGKKCKEYGFFA